MEQSGPAARAMGLDYGPNTHPAHARRPNGTLSRAIFPPKPPRRRRSRRTPNLAVAGEEEGGGGRRRRICLFELINLEQPGEEPCPIDPWIVVPDKSKYVDQLLVLSRLLLQIRYKITSMNLIQNGPHFRHTLSVSQTEIPLKFPYSFQLLVTIMSRLS